MDAVNPQSDHPRTSGEDAEVEYARRPFWLGLAVLAVAAWWGFLFTVAALTASPVVLNVQQILQTDAIVTGVVLEGGHVRVEKTLYGGGVGDEIEVDLLDEMPTRAGTEYLIPLTRTVSGWTVTVPDLPLPGDGPDGRPRTRPGQPQIYPAGAETELQLSEVLTADGATR